jgi:hypothetical protein
MESDRMSTVDDMDGAPEGCIAIVVRGTTNEHERRDLHDGPYPKVESRVPPSTVIYFREVLAVKSSYLSALLGSGMKEAQARRVDLTRLDPRAVRAVFRYLQDPAAAFDSMLRSCFRHWHPDDVRLVVEAFDYLQVAENDAIVQALQLLRGRGGVRSECVRQGWFDEEKWRVISMPSNRKTRRWRFWVCLLLSLQLMPEPCTPQDQVAFTESLKTNGSNEDAITLRRELVEYGLISRAGDGSEYWRPLYTSRMMSRWIDGMPRPIV